tara:strand:+ start:5432 stop:5815 length:384 start_codon:yes stop_codon:yes gene_type:complete
MNFKTIRVVTNLMETTDLKSSSLGQLKAKSLDSALSLYRDIQRDEILRDLLSEVGEEEFDDNVEFATEFFKHTGRINEQVGWVESGEEGVVLVVEEGSKWYSLLSTSAQWDEDTWEEFDELVDQSHE